MLLTDLPTHLAGGAQAREMTLHDIPAVHTLELDLFPADAWPLDMFLAEITHETRGYVVLEIPTETGPQVIGYAGLMSVADTADVKPSLLPPPTRGTATGEPYSIFSPVKQPPAALNRYYWRYAPITPGPRTST